MRLAVYRNGMPTETVEQRRAAYVGSVGAGFNVDDLMKGVLDKDVARHMRFMLYDAGSASEQTPLFPANGCFSTAVRRAMHSRHSRFPASCSRDTSDRGRRTHMGDSFHRAKRSSSNRSISSCRGSFSSAASSRLCCLSGLFYSLASSRSRAVAIANDMTKHLRASEASLAEAQRMAHLGQLVARACEPQLHDVVRRDLTASSAIESGTQRPFTFAEFPRTARIPRTGLVRVEQTLA